MTLGVSSGHFIDVAGLRTYYLKEGTGMPLVLFHGAPGSCSLDDWRANIEPLAQAGFSVYAYDQPGFGYTDPPTDYSLEFRVQHGRAFIEAVGLERFHLVAYSQGSYVAARIALEDPRVDRLVLVSGGTVAGRGAEAGTAGREGLNRGLGTWRVRPLGPATEATRSGGDSARDLASVREATRRALYHPDLATDEMIRLRYEMSSGAHYETIQKQRVSPRPPGIWDDLRGLKPKTLIFWGLHDPGPAVERALMLLEQLPDADLHVFAHSAHWVQLDEADRFNQLTVQFLRKQ